MEKKRKLGGKMEDKHIMFGGKREHPRRFEKTSNLFDFKLNLSLKVMELSRLQCLSLLNRHKNELYI